MTANGAAIDPATSQPMIAEQAAEITAKLAVMTADILDLDDRLTRLANKHRDHTSGGAQ